MSLYEQIGGAETIAALVPRLYARVLTDHRLVSHFRGRDMGWLAYHQAQFLTALLGGPHTYEARGLRETHLLIHITDPEFDAFIEHLEAAAGSLGIDPRILTVLCEHLQERREAVVALPARRPAD
ncbi:group 1 truncated hemoglobin [Actinomadura kijaniata]|uniref:Hemoglobin n=1 Tax=Actinomadura namibiensis TaxID=182080 RepID=A0A7W3M073_ACTNM|nr:group 1 truncated hemoglobin [Actinomadura namibiensis]MBA8957413.1 hemoglobin [Actinomadura namibiensis]